MRVWQSRGLPVEGAKKDRSTETGRERSPTRARIGRGFPVWVVVVPRAVVVVVLIVQQKNQVKRCIIVCT